MNSKFLIRNAIIWRIILFACEENGEISSAALARKRLIDLDPEYGGDDVAIGSREIGGIVAPQNSAEPREGRIFALRSKTEGLTRTGPKLDRDRSGPFFGTDGLGSVPSTHLRSVFGLPYSCVPWTSSLYDFNRVTHEKTSVRCLSPSEGPNEGSN